MDSGFRLVETDPNAVNASLCTLSTSSNRLPGAGSPVTRIGTPLRHKEKLHHIGIGCPYAGWRIVMLIDGLDIQVLGLDGSPLRHLTLDSSVDYQRMP